MPIKNRAGEGSGRDDKLGEQLFNFAFASVGPGECPFAGCVVGLLNDRVSLSCSLFNALSGDRSSLLH
jgi:hypothetical protein